MMCRATCDADSGITVEPSAAARYLFYDSEGRLVPRWVSKDHHDAAESNALNIVDPVERVVETERDVKCRMNYDLRNTLAHIVAGNRSGLIIEQHQTSAAHC